MATFTGTNGADQLPPLGSDNSGDDIIRGLGGNDVLIGGDGSDLLAGGNGSDSLQGGAGLDTADYSDSPAYTSVTVDLTAGTGRGSDGLLDTLTGIESVIGSTGGDNIGGSAADNTLIGGSGDDILRGWDGNDILRGGDGRRDVLHGGAGADSLEGGEGARDTAIYFDSAAPVTVNLTTGAGSGGDAQGDTLTGIESLTGSAGNDILTGSAGENFIEGEAGADTIAGLDGNDSLNGGDGADTLTGSAGDDQLNGGDGADALIGGDGVDWVSYGAPGLAAGVTIDLIAGTGSGGDAEGDTLTGIENVSGTRSADRLYGDAGQNLLSGDEGNDFLDGGAGADDLRGGADIGGVSGGIDTASYLSATSGIGLDMWARGTGDAAGDVLRDIDIIVGSNFDDVIWYDIAVHGGDGNDTLTGTGINGKLYGDAGDDTLKGTLMDGGAGADQLIGSGRVDELVSYLNSAAAVTVALSGVGSGGDAQGDTYVDIDNVEGSGLADQITGDALANALSGLAGDDVLAGVDGNDVLAGGVGADQLDGGAGIDKLDYSSAQAAMTIHLGTHAVGGAALGDTFTGMEGVIGSGFGDTLTGGDGDDVIDGGAGADVIDGGAGIDKLEYSSAQAAVTIDLGTGAAQGDTFANMEGVIGSGFGDTLIGNSGDNVVEGRGGTDVIRGGDGNDMIDGGDGNDTIDGDAGADMIDGGASYSVDTANYSDSAARVSVSLATGMGSGGTAAGDVLIRIENLDGSQFDDSLTGGAGENMLRGLDGNDLLWGGLRGDMIDGGAGIDTASYSDSATGVTIGLRGDRGSGGVAEDDRLYQVENLDGSQGHDILTGNDAINTLQGQDGSDGLMGEAGNDVLRGGIGGDVLWGGAGADTIDGGAGNNTASYTDSFQGVTVDLGNGVGTGGIALGDVLIGIWNLHGSLGDDTLTGDAGANLLDGRDGDDALYGGAGADTLYGSRRIGHPSGDDRLVGGEGADVLDGGDGSDWAYYHTSMTGVAVNLAIGAGTDGDAAGDSLISIENLYGSTLADSLSGDAGSNLLRGSMGADTLMGGAGADFFLYAATPESAVAAAGQDTITDFSGVQGDKIALGSIDADGNAANGDTAFTFTAGGAFTGTGHEVTVQGSGGVYTVLADINGDSTADFAIGVQSATALIASDFTL